MSKNLNRTFRPLPDARRAIKAFGCLLAVVSKHLEDSDESQQWIEMVMTILGVEHCDEFIDAVMKAAAGHQDNTDLDKYVRVIRGQGPLPQSEPEPEPVPVGIHDTLTYTVMGGYVHPFARVADRAQQ